MDILYEMKIRGFHELSLRFFRLAVVFNIKLCSSRILFYYEMKIGRFHEFKIFRLAMSLICAASFVDILYEMKIEGRFQELSLRFLSWQRVCFLRGYYFVRDGNWSTLSLRFFRLTVSLIRASFMDIILYEMKIGRLSLSFF